MKPNTKPSVFIGSSKEGLGVAEIVHTHLEHHCRPYTWTNHLFVPGTFVLESLEHVLRSFPFAIIVGTPDDPIVKRGEALSSMRDNVLFELGLFVGALGRQRAFLLVPQTAELAIPSDLLGLTLLKYDHDRFAASPQDRMAALQTPCTEARNAILLAWGEQIGASERRLRMVSNEARHKALARLHTLIVQLRDLLVSLPSTLLDAAADRERFEQAKAAAVRRLDDIANTFRDDAALAGVVPEFDGLVGATKSTIAKFPFPIDFAAAKEEVIAAIANTTRSILERLPDVENVAKDLLGAMATEMTRQLTAVGERYERWWTASQPRLSQATTRLQDAIGTANLKLTQELLSADRSSAQ